MNHPHSDQRNLLVAQHAPALLPYIYLVNAPVSPLDHRSSALVSPHHTEDLEDEHCGTRLGSTGWCDICDDNRSDRIGAIRWYPNPTDTVELSPIVDGEVLTVHTSPAPTRTMERNRSLLRRAVDDPYWILMTLVVGLGLSILGTVIYGAVQITLVIGAWLHANGTTLAGIATLIILLMLCGGTTAAKCAGIHCGGCRG